MNRVLPLAATARLLVVPLMPDPNGTGLARRAFGLLKALSASGDDVHLIVFHIYGGREDAPHEAIDLAHTITRIEPWAFTDTHARLIEMFGQGTSAYPKPWPMRFCTPSASEAVGDAAPDNVGVVMIMRLALAPLVQSFAARPRRPLLVLDFDEDDALREERLSSQGLGSHNEASVWRTALTEWSAAFDRFTASTDQDAVRLSNATGRSVRVVANPLPMIEASERQGSSSVMRLLFVGSLDYAPNADAVRWLSQEIVPAIRNLWPGRLVVDVVGPGGSEIGPLDVAMCVHGWVEDLTVVYALADIAVAPIRAGAGSRLKILEAFSAGVPVISTPIGAEGLLIADGINISLAEDAVGFAQACVALKNSPERALSQARAAREGLDHRHGSKALAHAMALALS